MVVVNDKLGNGFVINAVDSSLDQEHYFSGAKKFLRVKNLGVTFERNVIVNSGTAFYGIDAAPGGELIVCGTKDVGGVETWWVLRRITGQNNFQEVDLYTSVSGSGPSIPYDIAIDPLTTQVMYACGRHASGTTDVPVQGIIRKSLDAGLTWNLDFAASAGNMNANLPSQTAAGDWGSSFWEINFDLSASITQTHTASYSTAWFTGEKRSGSTYDFTDFANSAWGSMWTRTGNAGSTYQTGNFSNNVFQGLDGLGTNSSGKSIFRTMAYHNFEDTFNSGREVVSAGGFLSASVSGGFISNVREYTQFGFHHQVKTTPVETDGGSLDSGFYSVVIPTTGSLWSAGSVHLTASESRYATVHHRHLFDSTVDPVTFTDEYHTAEVYPTSSAQNFGNNCYYKLAVDTSGHVPFSGSLPDGTNGRENVLEQSGSFHYYALGFFTAAFGKNSSLLLRKSPDAGQTWYTLESEYGRGNPTAYYDAAFSDGILYVCGQFNGNGVVIEYRDNGNQEFALGNNSFPVTQHIELHSRLIEATQITIDTTSSLGGDLFGFQNPANTEPLSFINGLPSYVPLTEPFTGSIYEVIDPKISFEVSASGFDTNNICVEFKDATTDYLNLRPFGVYEELDDGYTKFTTRSRFKNVGFVFNENFPIFRVSAMSGVHNFRNFEVEFLLPLTDEGVRKLHDIENQNIEDINLNVSIMPGIE